jgi:hypothetical protein
MQINYQICKMTDKEYQTLLDLVSTFGDTDDIDKPA